ncbi:major facilitator superfamily domain-containing protein [Apodospora peruviana]|uniref:Major facilitator superfamily domain-containing protein n=1 Tax=Apodospora peruviana TaxID=516989 RepID=A0AAE0HTR3_9PEZI|nr:major facilitator superfamily domain-containing protein [Apodospora peruviana]
MGSKSTALREYFATAGYHRPGERRLVQKIDFFILTFCCLSYFLNYLDRSNLANAYVSGMKEDLNFSGDQLNQINTCFTIGYVIGQIPSNLSLHYVKPRYFFPFMMFIWAGLTMVTASVHSPNSIMTIRFFQGIAESSTFVGTHYILGSWYTERELGKRSGIFTASGLAGTMIGGFIQTGIHSSMDGKHGLRGWRWLFVVDGIITLPVAIYGLLLFPDTPATTTAFYLSQSEREMAMSRVSLVDRPSQDQSAAAATDRDLSDSSSGPAPQTQQQQQPASSPPKRKILTWHFAKRVLTSYEWWGFVILWIIAGETESFSSNSLLSLYMKATPPPDPSKPSIPKYTIAQLNNYPTGVPAVGIVSTLFWATLTDFLGGKRYLVGYFIGVTGVVTSAMILGAAHSSDPTGNKSTAIVFGAYYWAGTVYACQATFFAWANDAMRSTGQDNKSIEKQEEDAVFRSVVLAGMNLGSGAVNAWWSIVFYGASMAPWFERGMYAMIATSIALALWTAGLSYMASRAERRKDAGLPKLEGEDLPPQEVSAQRREKATTGASV